MANNISNTYQFIFEKNKLTEDDYNQIIDNLKLKYGKVSGNYILKTRNNTYRKNTKITRGDEGLFIHHVMERDYINLSSPDFYECLTEEEVSFLHGSDNLVYCDYLEHLMLHVVISILGSRGLTQKRLVKNSLSIIKDVDGNTNRVYKSISFTPIVGVGGVINHIVPEINKYFHGYNYKREWQKKALSLIDFDEYIKILLFFKDNFDNILPEDKSSKMQRDARIINCLSGPMSPEVYFYLLIKFSIRGKNYEESLLYIKEIINIYESFIYRNFDFEESSSYFKYNPEIQEKFINNYNGLFTDKVTNVINSIHVNKENLNITDIDKGLKEEEFDIFINTIKWEVRTLLRDLWFGHMIAGIMMEKNDKSVLKNNEIEKVIPENNSVMNRIMEDRKKIEEFYSLNKICVISYYSNLYVAEVVGRTEKQIYFKLIKLYKKRSNKVFKDKVIKKNIYSLEILDVKKEDIELTPYEKQKGINNTLLIALIIFYVAIIISTMVFIRYSVI